MGKKGPEPQSKKPAEKKAVETTKENQPKQLTPEEQRRKKSAEVDYEKKLADVRDLEEMTDTDSWRRIHTELQSSMNQHRKSLEDAEGKDVIRHQEGLKILRAVIEKVKKPVDDLNNFVVNTGPLFSGNMKYRAEWNTALGKVELREV